MEAAILDVFNGISSYEKAETTYGVAVETLHRRVKIYRTTGKMEEALKKGKAIFYIITK